MTAVLTTIRPTTEVEAVNICLGAIGEAPIPDATDLSTYVTNDANVDQAVRILKETIRETLTAGWRFNTLTGYELAPTTTYSWVDTAGVTTLLNIFKTPVDALAWTQTPCREMQGAELVERMSLKYQETSAPVKVLFDRWKNRDGLETTRYPRVYLDIAFAGDFTNLPECARKFITITAARRFAERVPGSEMEAGFQKGDALAALRVLKREQGLVKQLNLFNTADAYDFLGRRQPSGGGYSTKVYPGGS